MDPMCLIHPSTACIFGASMSGKTSFCVRLVRQADKVYTNKFDEIIWCYGGGENAVPRKALKGVRNLKFYKGLPASFSEFSTNSLIICDDCTQESANSDTIYKASLMGTHHQTQSLILVLHNIFTPGRKFKSVSVNSHYYFLFKSPLARDQVDILCRRVRPRGWRELADIYEREVVKEDNNYLLLDLHPATKKQFTAFRVRNNILPDDGVGHIFCTEEEYNALQNAETEDGTEKERE